MTKLFMLPKDNVEIVENGYECNVDEETLHFSLSEDFIERYKNLECPTSSSYQVTLVRTYAPNVLEHEREYEYYEFVRRVVEITFQTQKKVMIDKGYKWNETMAQIHAQNLFDKMWNGKFTHNLKLWESGIIERNRS